MLSTLTQTVTKAEAERASKALEGLFYGKAHFAYVKDKTVLEVRKHGWGYLLEYDEKEDRVLSNLRLVLLGADGDDYSYVMSYLCELAEEVAAM